MTEQETKERETLTTENAALKARIEAVEVKERQSLAVATVGAVLKEAGIQIGARLLERACAHPTFKDQTPDPEWVKAVVTDLTEGVGAEVRGLGDGAVREAVKPEDIEKRLTESLQALGVPADGLKYAVAGRV